MELFGGSLVQAEEFQKQVLQRIETAAALDPDVMARILEGVLQNASGYWGLVWPGDHTIHGDWELDRNEPWVKENRIIGVACFGDLTIDGDLRIKDHEYWPPLFVAGTLRIRNLLKGGPPLFVLGDLRASGYYVAAYNDGPLRVGGDLVAAGYIHRSRDYDGIPGHLTAGRIEARAFNADGSVEPRKLREVFVPEVIMRGYLVEEEILDRQHADLPVWRDPADAAADPPPPPPPPVPEVRSVDPVALGALITATEAEARLADWNKAEASDLEPKLRSRADGKVLLLPHDTHLSGDLELDWNGVEWMNRHGIIGIACDGDLTVDGDVLNWELDFGPFLFVKGDLKLQNLIKAGSPVTVLGNVEASGLVVGEYNHGRLDVGGNLSAHAYILLDHAGYVAGEVNAPTLNDSEDDLQELLEPRAFEDERDTSPDAKLLWALQRAGVEVLLGRS